MNSQPTISVIIPAWNEAARIERAVTSAWDAGANEVRVVDADSQDGTPARALAAGATVLRSRLGRGEQQSRGVPQASGQLLVFLHADSFFEPAAFDCLRWACARQPDRIRWGCFQQVIADPRWRFRLVEAGNHWRVACWQWVYGDQALWVQADLLQQVGGFPQEPLMEDLILSRRLAKICRPWPCPTRVYTSARKWQREGVVRRTLGNWWLLAQYFAGVDPAVLAVKYRKSGPSMETKDANRGGVDE